MKFSLFTFSTLLTLALANPIAEPATTTVSPMQVAPGGGGGANQCITQAPAGGRVLCYECPWPKGCKATDSYRNNERVTVICTYEGQYFASPGRPLDTDWFKVRGRNGGPNCWINDSALRGFGSRCNLPGNSFLKCVNPRS